MKFNIKGHDVEVKVNGKAQAKLSKKMKLSDKGVTLEQAIRDFKKRSDENKT